MNFGGMITQNAVNHGLSPPVCDRLSNGVEAPKDGNGDIIILVFTLQTRHPTQMFEIVIRIIKIQNRKPKPHHHFTVPHQYRRDGATAHWLLRGTLRTTLLQMYPRVYPILNSQAAPETLVGASELVCCNEELECSVSIGNGSLNFIITRNSFS